MTTSTNASVFPKELFKGICPQCEKGGSVSVVYTGESMTTNNPSGFFDDLGNYVSVVDGSEIVTECSCSLGHNFTIQEFKGKLWIQGK